MYKTLDASVIALYYCCNNCAAKCHCEDVVCGVAVLTFKTKPVAASSEVRNLRSVSADDKETLMEAILEYKNSDKFFIRRFHIRSSHMIYIVCIIHIHIFHGNI